MHTWPVQDAKARFSEMLDACIAKGPQIVITNKKMNLNSRISKFRNLSKQPAISLWHYGGILEPKIENIAQQVNGCCIFLHLIKQSHYFFFVLPPIGNQQRTQVNIR